MVRQMKRALPFILCLVLMLAVLLPAVASAHPGDGVPPPPTGVVIGAPDQGGGPTGSGDPDELGIYKNPAPHQGVPIGASKSGKAHVATKSGTLSPVAWIVRAFLFGFRNF
jgi:hypothetical protein